VSERVEPSEYARYYFPSVLARLKERGVDRHIQETCGIEPAMEV
jgi:hypothetical protein